MIRATAPAASTGIVSSTSFLELVPQVFFHTLARESVRCTGEVQLTAETVEEGGQLQVSLGADLTRVMGLGMSRGRRYTFGRSKLSFEAAPPFPAVRIAAGEVGVETAAALHALADVLVTLLVKPDGRVTANDVRITGVSRRRSPVSGG